MQAPLACQQQSGSKSRVQLQRHPKQGPQFTESPSWETPVTLVRVRSIPGWPTRSAAAARDSTGSGAPGVVRRIRNHPVQASTRPTKEAEMEADLGLGLLLIFPMPVQAQTAGWTQAALTKSGALNKEPFSL